MNSSDGWLARKLGIAVLVTAALCPLWGCHKDETPPASSGYYAGSDYTKGGNPSLPNKGKAAGTPATPGAQPQ